MQFPYNEKGWQKPLTKSSLELFIFVEEKKKKENVSQSDLAENI